MRAVNDNGGLGAGVNPPWPRPYKPSKKALKNIAHLIAENAAYESGRKQGIEDVLDAIRKLAQSS